MVGTSSSQQQTETKTRILRRFRNEKARNTRTGHVSARTGITVRPQPGTLIQGSTCGTCLALTHGGAGRCDPVQEALAKISKARTVVRQMKTLGKAKKLAKAEAKLAKLKAKEARTRKGTGVGKEDILYRVINLHYYFFVLL